MHHRRLLRWHRADLLTGVHAPGSGRQDPARGQPDLPGGTERLFRYRGGGRGDHRTRGGDGDGAGPGTPLTIPAGRLPDFA